MSPSSCTLFSAAASVVLTIWFFPSLSDFVGDQSAFSTYRKGNQKSSSATSINKVCIAPLSSRSKATVSASTSAQLSPKFSLATHSSSSLPKVSLLHKPPISLQSRTFIQNSPASGHNSQLPSFHFEILSRKYCFKSSGGLWPYPVCPAKPARPSLAPGWAALDGAGQEEGKGLERDAPDCSVRDPCSSQAT